MVCSFLVTITVLMSGPTKHNTQGILKVKQYRYSEFLRAHDFAKSNMTIIGLDSTDSKYPKIIGSELQKLDGMKCNFDGEEYQ